jgi:predicted metal-dependent phosphoesterase TrpH
MSREIEADLHMHTTASDGTSTLKERVEQAQEKNLGTIAVTDHDTINPDLDGRYHEVDGVEIISGVEIKTEINGDNIEILCYFINPENTELYELLEEVRSNRRDRNRKIAENINQKTVAEIDLDELREEEADGFVSRPHFAKKLIEQDTVEDISEAFGKHLSTKGDCYTPMERIPAGKVISIAHSAGAVCSLAHPGRAKTDDIENIISELEDLGLDALEVYYPYQENPPERYAGTTEEEAGKLAEKFDLLKTGGSDCHGPGSGKFRIGEKGLRRENLKILKQKGKAEM